MTGHRNERVAVILQWAGIFAYAITAYGMCHDGTSAVEFGFLLGTGSVILPLLVLADWISRGMPQVDADVRRE